MRCTPCIKHYIADVCGVLAYQGRYLKSLVDLGLPVEHLLMQHAHVLLLLVAVVLAAEQLLPLRSAKAPSCQARSVSTHTRAVETHYHPLKPLCSEIHHKPTRFRGHWWHARHASGLRENNLT